MKNKDNGKICLRLASLGSKFGISFSNCIPIGNKWFGWDRIMSKLLVSEESDEVNQSQIIELDRIKSISVKRGYSSIKPGELRKRKFEEFLKFIHLQFEYIDDVKPTILSLYESGKDQMMNLRKLDSNSRKLHLMLSKMIGANKDDAVQESMPLPF